MNTEQCLKIIKEEIRLQAASHNKAAASRALEYAKNNNPDLLFDSLRLMFTSQALLNFSQALNLEKFKEWRKSHEE